MASRIAHVPRVCACVEAAKCVRKHVCFSGRGVGVGELGRVRDDNDDVADAADAGFLILLSKVLR